MTKEFHSDDRRYSRLLESNKILVVDGERMTVVDTQEEAEDFLSKRNLTKMRRFWSR